jgi:hypothetical protein
MTNFDYATRFNALESRLAVIEAHLGISRAAGVTLDDGRTAEPPSAEVMAQVVAGNMLQAVTLYRAQINCTLPQAREVLEGIGEA